MNRARPSREDVSRALAGALAEQRLRIVASLIRTTHDWDLAEDVVADAAERALRRWPEDGVPSNPAAWLTTTARRRAVDLLRRADTERAKLAEVALMDDLASTEQPTPAGAVSDDRLRLVFTCCHPALPLEGRVALTCKVVAGLSTEAVARAFLVSEATMSQRLLRAKQKIAHAGIGYTVPTADMLPGRVDGVLAVVYLVFTTGWAARADDALAEEAIRLGRLLVELMPDADEPRGLLALMLLQHARRAARLVDGELVTLEHQDRSRWDVAGIEEARALAALPGGGRGPYRLQAELAAVHATAPDAAQTDWPAIVRLYDELLLLHPSPVVGLNRAIAVAMADGPHAGLAALDALAEDRALRGFHLLPAARGDLLARAGRTTEALTELREAARLAPTERERRQLERRRAELSG
ncbi:MAG TPA: sigma-70 family RNA polymerase sigma factor [Nocardioidaceae bacterium]|nr:sigma-70 family RNA polymerase sigma factor [Nocardioidaceae bacterium]